MLLDKSVLDILDEKDYGAMNELPIAISRNYCHIHSSINYRVKSVGADLNDIISPYFLSTKHSESEYVSISTYCNGIELIKAVLCDLILRYKDCPYDIFLSCLNTNRFFIEMKNDFNEEKVSENLNNIALGIMEHNHIENREALYIMDLLESDSIRGYVYDLAYDVQDYCSSVTDRTIELHELKDEFEKNKMLYKYFTKEICIELEHCPKDIFYGASIVHEQLLGIFNVREIRSNHQGLNLATDFYSVVYDILRNTSECQTPREFNEQLQVEFITRNITEPYDESLAKFINSVQLKNLLRQTKYLGANLYNKLSEV